MIIVADSGSTKTSWLILSDKGDKLFEETTAGLNPAIFPKAELQKRILSNKKLIDIKDNVKSINFFGAGCGKKIHQKVISLGYIVMDDASGNYYGKQLLKAYYFNKMPKELALKFKENYNLDPDFIKENLYRKSNPNTYLASLCHFMIDYKTHPFCQEMIKVGLKLFIENQILQFDNAKELPINFVGSIAHFLTEEIDCTLKEYGLTLGVIQRHPIKGFVEKHIKLN